MLKQESTIKLFEKHGVLSKRELNSRYEVYTETYEATIKYEASCAIHLAKTMIIPACLGYQEELSQTIKSVEGVSKSNTTRATRDLLKNVCQKTDKVLAAIQKLESVVEGKSTVKTVAAMEELREVVDALEGLVSAEKWPLPSYTEMLFVM